MSGSNNTEAFREAVKAFSEFNDKWFADETSFADMRCTTCGKRFSYQAHTNIKFPTFHGFNQPMAKG